MSDLCMTCALPVGVSGGDFLKCIKCGELVHTKCCVQDASKKPPRKASFKCIKCNGASASNSANSSDVEDAGTAAILRAIQDLDHKLGAVEKKMTTSMESKFSSLELKIKTMGDKLEGSLEAVKQ